MEPSASFGYWMSRQLKALDLTQQALADLVGYSVRLLGIAKAMRNSLGLPLRSFKQIWQQRMVNDIAAQLPPDALEAEEAIGRELTMERAIEYALQGIS